MRISKLQMILPPYSFNSLPQIHRVEQIPMTGKTGRYQTVGSPIPTAGVDGLQKGIRLSFFPYNHVTSKFE